jgi:hypothetical protein
MVQIPSCEFVTQDSQEILGLLRNPEGHYQVHESVPGVYPDPNEFSPQIHTLFL